MKAFQNDLRVFETAKFLDAGIRRSCGDPDAIALGLPNRGLALASGIGKLLQIPVEVFIAQNLRAPCPCPCTIGGLTEANVIRMDQSVISRQQWPYRELRAFIEREAQKQQVEIELQRQLLRSGQALPDLAGRQVLFVDDGTTPLATLLASLASFRKLGAGRIVVAMPSNSREIVREVELCADDFIAIGAMEPFINQDLTRQTSSGKPPLVA